MKKIIPLNSIRFKLVTGLIIILVPLIALLIYNNFYAINVIHNQVALSNKNMISMYMGEIDNGLKDIDNYLGRLVGLDTNLQIMEYTDDASRYNIAEFNFSKRISEDILLSKNIDSVFIYPIKQQLMVSAYNEGSTFQQKEDVENYISNLIKLKPDSDELSSKGWFTKEINKEYYVIRIFKADDVYIGAWVSAKKLLIPMNMINLGSAGSSLLTTDKGKIMFSSNKIQDKNIDLSGGLQEHYLTGDNNKYLAIGKSSINGNFSLIALIPDATILEKLPLLKRISKIIAIASILLLPLSLLFLRKNILVPLNRIIASMKRIKNGDLDERIGKFDAADEFILVNQTFNNMITQIKKLKINVYEDQINMQKAELKHLQLQINPHFFMNSLNIIYSLAIIKDFRLIQEMTLCLVNYFRYMFESNSNFMKIERELEHIKNYLKIQEMRFPERFSYEISVSDNLLNEGVPTLMLQTFVENTIKYSVSMSTMIKLSINIVNENEYITITIMDTGKGFDEEILKKLNSDTKLNDGKGSYIGIWNVKQRLKLLYSNDYKLQFSNFIPTGAIIEIKIPKSLEK